MELVLSEGGVELGGTGVGEVRVLIDRLSVGLRFGQSSGHFVHNSRSTLVAIEFCTSPFLMIVVHVGCTVLDLSPTCLCLTAGTSGSVLGAPVNEFVSVGL